MTFTKSVLRLDVTPAQKLVLLAIKGERSKIISIDQLCQLTRLSDKAVRMALQRLGKLKLLLIEQRAESSGRYASSRYLLNIDGIAERLPAVKSTAGDTVKFTDPIYIGKSCDPETAKNTTPPEERNQGNIVEFPR